MKLIALYTPHWENQAIPYPNPASIDGAIELAFLQLDQDIMNSEVITDPSSKNVGQRQAKFLNAAISLLAPGYAGSCALLSMYDSKTKLLRVACVGNSRAVLGRRSSKGTYSAIALSIDQTAWGNNQEIERVRAEHPGEPDVITGGRLLGRKGESATFKLLQRFEKLRLMRQR